MNCLLFFYWMKKVEEETSKDQIKLSNFVIEFKDKITKNILTYDHATFLKNSENQFFCENQLDDSCNCKIIQNSNSFILKKHDQQRFHSFNCQKKQVLNVFKNQGFFLNKKEINQEKILFEEKIENEEIIEIFEEDEDEMILKENDEKKIEVVDLEMDVMEDDLKFFEDTSDDEEIEEINFDLYSNVG